MAKEITICLKADEWEQLAPHLPEGVCPQLADDVDAIPMLDCREVSDDAEYERLLAIAKAHCPHLVREIEKQRKLL